MNLTILIVDDHKMVRDGLRSLIESKSKTWCVIGEAANGREAIRLAADTQPDIVLVDVAMPELNGIDASRKILARSPASKIIALSMHADSAYVAQMIEAGASAYLRKESAFEEISAAIEAVCLGKVFLGDGIAIATEAKRSDLSPREREVLQLIAEGRKTSEIAKLLFVSVKTIETHRRQIMHKLAQNNVADLTKYAIRQGLTSIDP